MKRLFKFILLSLFCVTSVSSFAIKTKMSQAELDFWNNLTLKPVLQQYAKVYALGSQYGWYDNAWIKKSILKNLSKEDKDFLKIRINSFGAPVLVTIKDLEAHYIVRGQKVVINFERFYAGELQVNNNKILFDSELSLKQNFKKYFKPKQSYFNKYQKNSKFNFFDLLFPQAHASFCSKQEVEMSINTGLTIASIAKTVSPPAICSQVATACIRGICKYQEEGSAKAAFMEFGKSLPYVSSALQLQKAGSYCKQRLSAGRDSGSPQDSSKKQVDVDSSGHK